MQSMDNLDVIGQPIPSGEHSISVSLPTWDATLSYKKGEPQVLNQMKAGYPRFFIPLAVREVRTIFEAQNPLVETVSS